MPNPNETRDPVELLAEEFLARRRRGGRVTAADYAAKYPELADEILDLFPTMLALEKLSDESPEESTRPADAFEHPAQLGDLKLIREIGRGGMGIVYEAEQESLGRRVAVKILPERALFDTRRLERFRREARTAGGLQHPNIVPIYGVGEEQGLHYLIMQLVEGAGLDVLAKLVGDIGSGDGGRERSSQATRSAEGLAESLARALVANDFDSTGSGSSLAAKLAGPTAGAYASAKTDAGDNAPTVAFSDSTIRQALSEASLVIEPGSGSFAKPPQVGKDYFAGVARIGIQAAEALAYAHACGTLHRDIKPANLLLDRRGNLWITDFGLAKAMGELASDADNLSRTGEMVGTLRYMAPEQFDGHTDARSDLYSLGLTLYELVTWRPAFEAAAPSELIRKITTEAPAPPRKLNPQTPRDLETIILQATAREAGDRYQTGDELAADLRRFLEAIPVAARRDNAPRRGVQWVRRNPMVAGLMAAVLLLGGTTLLGMTGFFRAPPPGAPLPAPDAGEPRGDDPVAEAPWLPPHGPPEPFMGPPPPRDPFLDFDRERRGPRARRDGLGPDPRRPPPGADRRPPRRGPPHDPLGLGPGHHPPPRRESPGGESPPR